MKEILSYEAIDQIIALDQQKGFPESSCFDYLDSLGMTKDGKCYSIVFVEPCGDITKKGPSFLELLNWWTDVFKSQPAEWDYIKAGWHLYNRFCAHQLLECPQDNWKPFEN